MKRGLNGFTLIELLVVVLIIGILGTISITYYVGSVEDEKLDSATAQVQAIASAERMYALANSGSYSGDTTAAIANPTASGSGSCLIATNAQNSTCPANSGSFLAAQNWSAFAYNFFGGGPNCLAWATRKTTGAGSTSSSPYNGWEACVLTSGALCGTNTSCACSCP